MTSEQSDNVIEVEGKLPSFALSSADISEDLDKGTLEDVSSLFDSGIIPDPLGLEAARTTSCCDDVSETPFELKEGTNDTRTKFEDFVADSDPFGVEDVDVRPSNLEGGAEPTDLPSDSPKFWSEEVGHYDTTGNFVPGPGEHPSLHLYCSGSAPYFTGEHTGTKGLTCRSPVCRAFPEVLDRDNAKSFFIVPRVSGNLRSRRFQAAHYGLAVAGFVISCEDLEDFTSEVIPWTLPPISQADPLSGLSSACIGVTQNDTGMWPFGLIGTSDVVWLPVPVLGYCALLDIAFEYHIGTMGVKTTLPTNAEICIVEVERGSRTENICCVKDGAFVPVKGLIEPRSEWNAMLSRNLVIVANAARGIENLCDGPFPNMVADFADPTTEPIVSGMCLLESIEAILLGQLQNPRYAFHMDVDNQLYWWSWGSEATLAQGTQRIARALSLDGAYTLPGFEMRAETLDELNRDYELGDVFEPTEREDQELRHYEGPLIDVVVPGTTVARLVDATPIRVVPVPSGVVPFCAAPVHPHSRVAQSVFNKCAVSSGLAGTWVLLELPTKTVARTSTRPRGPRQGSIHVGDQVFGDKIVNHMLVRSTPRIWLFEPVTGKVPNGEAALRALVRSAYSHGSPVIGLENFIEARSTTFPLAPRQSFVGLDERGEVSCEYYEFEDVQILHNHVKERLNSVRDHPEQLREFCVNLLQQFDLRRSVATADGPPEVPEDNPLEIPAGAGELCVLECSVGQKLSLAQAEQLAHLLLTETSPELVELLCEIGPRTFRTTLASVGVPVMRPAGPYSGQPVSVLGFCGALLGRRTPKNLFKSQTDPGKAKRDARSALLKEDSELARRNLLRLLAHPGPPIPGDDPLWSNANLTFEIADIPVADCQIDTSVTWASLLRYVESGDFVERISPRAAEDASATHDARRSRTASASVPAAAAVKSAADSSPSAVGAARAGAATTAAGPPASATAEEEPGPPDPPAPVPASSSGVSGTLDPTASPAPVAAKKRARRGKRGGKSRTTHRLASSTEEAAAVLKRAWDGRVDAPLRDVAILIDSYSDHKTIGRIKAALSGLDDSFLQTMCSCSSTLGALAAAIRDGGKTFPDIVAGRNGPGSANPFG